MIDNWEPERPDRLDPGWSFEGWLVKLAYVEFEPQPTTPLTAGAATD
jgi:hypothetical protein